MEYRTKCDRPEVKYQKTCDCLEKSKEAERSALIKKFLLALGICVGVDIVAYLINPAIFSGGLAAVLLAANVFFFLAVLQPTKQKETAAQAENATVWSEWLIAAMAAAIPCALVGFVVALLTIPVSFVYSLFFNSAHGLYVAYYYVLIVAWAVGFIVAVIVSRTKWIIIPSVLLVAVFVTVADIYDATIVLSDSGFSNSFGLYLGFWLTVWYIGTIVYYFSSSDFKKEEAEYVKCSVKDKHGRVPHWNDNTDRYQSYLASQKEIG